MRTLLMVVIFCLLPSWATTTESQAAVIVQRALVIRVGWRLDDGKGPLKRVQVAPGVLVVISSENGLTIDHGVSDGDGFIHIRHPSQKFKAKAYPVGKLPIELPQVFDAEEPAIAIAMMK